MTDERKNGSTAAADEPNLTQKNSATIRGEETLTREPERIETSTRVKSGVVPSSYGAAGGTTDATEEGGDGTGI